MNRTRDKEATKAALRAAILKAKNHGLCISISSVARDASIAPSTIHKVYPDIAEEIRELTGRSTRAQRNMKNAELTSAKSTIRDLRGQCLQFEHDLRKLASINYALKQRVERLEALHRVEGPANESKL